MEQTLAQFVTDKREKLGMSALGLAKKAHLPLKFLEDVEAGIELFLPVTARQNLARALRCNPDEIKYYERTLEIKEISSDELKEQILKGQTDLSCPVCGAPLVVRVAKMYDLEDNLVLEPKGHCAKCTFQIK
jgi:ribosome-binding protein aMBF1 (putative translation factor)